MSSENLHDASEAVVNKLVSNVPQNVLQKIKSAWVAALISASVTLVITLIAMSGKNLFGFSAWELIDVTLIFGLAFGIYKKSRLCAVLMFIYFIASKIALMAQFGVSISIVVAIAFAYFFWQGISGTFAYHKVIKS
jgi:hypothetical protein